MSIKKSDYNIDDKIQLLKDYLKNKRCILGFSAGSDSILIAYILSRVSSNSKLVTVDNMMMPDDFIEYAKKKAKQFNLKHEVIKLNFLEDEKFLENNPLRCYNCRDLMYYNITQVEDFNEYDYFLEGTNLTDLLEDRPGILILDKYNMTSPLVECSITKDDVFDILDYLGLDYSNNTTCLSTRVKTNEMVSREKLELIDKSEKLLRKYIRQENIRLRFDDYIGIISVDNPHEILDKKLLENIRDNLLDYGLKKVYLDITGYEKTKLEVTKDKDNTSYHQLPYSIDLNKTYRKLEHKYYGKSKIYDDHIEYMDIKIYKNGKISIDDDEDFIKRFYDILPIIQRKI